LDNLWHGQIKVLVAEPLGFFRTVAGLKEPDKYRNNYGRAESWSKGDTFSCDAGIDKRTNGPSNKNAFSDDTSYCSKRAKGFSLVIKPISGKDIKRRDNKHFYTI